MPSKTAPRPLSQNGKPCDSFYGRVIQVGVVCTSGSIRVFSKIGVPQNGWFIMENPFKIDALGVSLFSETSIDLFIFSPRYLRYCSYGDHVVWYQGHVKTHSGCLPFCTPQVRIYGKHVLHFRRFRPPPCRWLQPGR